MKNYVQFVARTLVSLLVAALAFATVATAQNNATGTVPFPFVANNHYWSAGSYQVQLLSDRLLKLRDLNTNKAQFVKLQAENNGVNSVAEGKGRLVFRNEGGRYYLMQVWFTGRSAHSNLLVQPNREPEVAKQMPPANSTFTVALK